MSASNELTNNTQFGLPIGCVIPYASAIRIPDDFLICDGASLLRSEYPDLFKSIGTTFGSVDGQHFNIPDLVDRYISGGINGTVTPAGVTGTLTFNAITTLNLPNAPIALNTQNLTFSGSINSHSCLDANPGGEACDNFTGLTTYVKENEASTFNGGTVTSYNMTLTSANPNTPITTGFASGADFTLQGYTMPYIIKARPYFVA